MFTKKTKKKRRCVVRDGAEQFAEKKKKKNGRKKERVFSLKERRRIHYPQRRGKSEGEKEGDFIFSKGVCGGGEQKGIRGGEIVSLWERKSPSQR